MLSGISDIRYLKGVGEKRAKLLQKLGIDSVDALLTFFPRSYKDLNSISFIYNAPIGQPVCLRCRVITPVKEYYIRKNMTLYKFTVSDSSGDMSVTIYNNRFLAGRINVGSEYLFYGKLATGSLLHEMSSPEIYETGYNRIIPVYSLTAGITSSCIQKLVKSALEKVGDSDILSSDIKKKYRLCDRAYAIKNIHFPASPQALHQSRRRLIFEELFLLQCGIAMFSRINMGKTSCVISNNYTDEFFSSLPFSPTSAQIRAVSECISDMSSSYSMNRLVEGDVGCGKTLVAAALMFNTAKNGYQAVLMAPTVILAEQHFKNISELLSRFSLECTLLTGDIKGAAKKAALENISSGKSKIIIGTHSVLSESTVFNNLGLVITDEQHRFGVQQRSALTHKGNRPHTLVMSATPIPRTLALAIYGELKISVIDEYPRGRQPIETYAVSQGKRLRAYSYIKEHLDMGRQAYVVCPAIEDENDQMNSVNNVYENLSSGILKGYKIGLLHGKMPASAKEDVMRRFADGDIDVLVATSVIEVGIDVANAAIMIIENAERFGLSQLHQLRGRIGRGPYKSTCIMISEQAQQNDRLSVLCKNTDGFRIAEEDLRLRGPGDFLGENQHGLPKLKIADMCNDVGALETAIKEARCLLDSDPRLTSPQNQLLKEELQRLFKDVLPN